MAALHALRSRGPRGVVEEFPEFQELVDRGPFHTVKHTFCRSGLLPMWVADMDLPVAPSIHAAIRARADHCTFGYTIQPPVLWESVSRWLQQQHGWSVQTDEFVFCSNLVTATTTAIEAFTAVGDRVAVVRPLYVPLQELITGANRELVAFDAGVRAADCPLSLDLEQFRETLSAHNVRALIWCSPHNPTGRVWTLAELSGVASICKDLGILIISDEIHADLTLWGLKHIPMALACQSVGYDRLVTTSGPGKTWNLAGLHCGYLVIQNSQLRTAYMKVAEHAYLHFGSTFATVGMLAAYQTGGEWRNRVCRYFESQIQVLESFLQSKIPEIVAIRPQASYLVWLDCSGLEMEAASGTDSELCLFFEECARLKLSDGFSFGGVPTCYFQRINVACSRAVLVEALHRLERAVVARRPRTYNKH